MRTILPQFLSKYQRVTKVGEDYIIPHPAIKNYFYRVAVEKRDEFERLSVDIWILKIKSKDQYDQVDRCATHREMLFIKDLFFSPEEIVIQFFPPLVEFLKQKNQLILWKYTGLGDQQIPKELTHVLESKDLADAVEALRVEFPGIEDDSEFYDAIYHANVPLGSDTFKDAVRKKLIKTK